MSGSQVQNFVTNFAPLAELASSQTGLPADYILGQAGLESGWGTSNAAVNGNNYFGISPGGQLASYSSPGAGFSAFANLMNSSNYSGVSSVAGQGSNAIAQYLNDQGYSTTPNYASLVSGAVSAVNGTGYGSSGSGTGTGTTASQSSGAGVAATIKSLVLGPVQNAALRGGVGIIAVVFVIFGLLALVMGTKQGQQVIVSAKKGLTTAPETMV